MVKTMEEGNVKIVLIKVAKKFVYLNVSLAIIISLTIMNQEIYR